jgi:holo-[acyl-carrier protein] synthase
MIVGVGVDIVDIARFTRALERTPKLSERLFTEAERTLPVASLAGRFAAKEALIKAFGGSGSMTWHEMSVVKDELGKPSFELSGAAAEMASSKGVSSVQLSISHDANAAVAFVVAEGGVTEGGAA